MQSLQAMKWEKTVSDHQEKKRWLYWNFYIHKDAIINTRFKE